MRARVGVTRRGPSAVAVTHQQQLAEYPHQHHADRHLVVLRERLARQRAQRRRRRLAGQQPAAEQTPSIGCNIKWHP